MQYWRFHKFIFILSILAIAPVAFAGSQDFGGLVLTEITPRIITPNADMRNDKVFFKFDSPLTGIPVDSNIYDLSGSKIKSMEFDLFDNALSWDGKNTSGQSVPSGIYLYQITIGKKSVTGTVVVAK